MKYFIEPDIICFLIVGHYWRLKHRNRWRLQLGNWEPGAGVGQIVNGKPEEAGGSSVAPIGWGSGAQHCHWCWEPWQHRFPVWPSQFPVNMAGEYQSHLSKGDSSMWGWVREQIIDGLNDSGRIGISISKLGIDGWPDDPGQEGCRLTSLTKANQLLLASS